MPVSDCKYEPKYHLLKCFTGISNGVTLPDLLCKQIQLVPGQFSQLWRLLKVQLWHQLEETDRTLAGVSLLPDVVFQRSQLAADLNIYK